VSIWNKWPWCWGDPKEPPARCARALWLDTRISGSAPSSKRQLRNRAKASWQQEAQLLDEVLSQAAQGAVVVVPLLKALLEKKLGKSLSLTTLYNMLHRHGWRKLAPDTAHPKGDPRHAKIGKKLPNDLA
jgi:hypothetical protein